MVMLKKYSIHSIMMCSLNSFHQHTVHCKGAGDSMNTHTCTLVISFILVKDC